MSDMNENVDNQLTNNTLAILALSNEYCAAIENADGTEPDDFIDIMLRLLPRLYIAASDIPDSPEILEDVYLTPSLDEETYDIQRGRIAALLGEDDTFLEVFMDEMKYSDTPIAVTISELLSDLFQVFYDFLETCRDAPSELINEATIALRGSFREYWSRTLTNVLRALNSLKYNL